MSLDIGHMLNDWEFDPDEFHARQIRGKNGVEKIQIRIDMGILQLEMAGRPDGQQPHGFASLLEYYEEMIEAHEQDIETGEPFLLEGEECEALFQEAWQYYHRYLSLFYLEDYDGVVEDTEHTLRIFSLVQTFADNEDDKWYFEQYYPHAVMMQARGRAMKALDKEHYGGALEEVRKGIVRIEQFIENWEEELLEEDLPELAFLTDWYEELEKERPLSQEEQLERELRTAVEAENFEEAARLRDKLKTIQPRSRGSYGKAEVMRPRPSSPPDSSS